MPNEFGKEAGWGEIQKLVIADQVLIGAYYLFTASKSVVKNAKVDLLMLNVVFLRKIIQTSIYIYVICTTISKVIFSALLFSFKLCLKKLKKHTCIKYKFVN